jgi:hypothetical protein
MLDVAKWHTRAIPNPAAHRKAESALTGASVPGSTNLTGATP